MDLEAVKRYLEEGGDLNEEERLHFNKTRILGLPSKFLELYVMQAVTVGFIGHSRLLCSMKVTTNMLNEDSFMHGSVIATVVDMVGLAVIASCGVPKTGVSLEINVSYIDAAYENEEIEIEATAQLVGMNRGVAVIELRKKKTGKTIAIASHTNYLGITSKLCTLPPRARGQEGSKPPVASELFISIG